MPTRHYSNVAQPTILTAPCSATDTEVQVQSLAGWPTQYPYTMVIDGKTAGYAEIVDVVGAAGLTLTVKRGQDNTVAVAHGLNAPCTHDHTARDYAEPQARLDALESTGGPVKFTQQFLFGGL